MLREVKEQMNHEVAQTVGSPSLNELQSKLDEQAQLLGEQQKRIQGIQHLQKQTAPNTQSKPLPHQSPPSDPFHSTTLLSIDPSMD